MKDRFTINFFVVVAMLFVVSSIVACQPKPWRCADDDPSCNPAHPANRPHIDAQLARAAETVEKNLAPTAAEQPSTRGLTGEEQMLYQDRNNSMAGAGDRWPDYLRKYQEGQKVFVLAPSMENCLQIEKEVDGGAVGPITESFDCNVIFGTMLTELSQACEIAEIEAVSGAFFVGRYARSPTAGANATSALVVRVSSCEEKKTE